ncbi:MAG: lamin tail domain-containing protein [Sphaerochaetaceae bacterium]|nr:lamin tail domain-containing protein [Sphaerochaetaceae bacterium]
MKHIKATILIILSLLFVSCPVSNAIQNNIQSTESIKLASWNIRILSNDSRDDSELQKIATIIDRYDIVAVQEVRDYEVINRLLNILPEEWDAIISNKTGRGVKEQYTYFYDSNIIQPLGTSYLFNDPDDLLIREPFISHFKASDFDFTLATIHSIYGDSINDRRAEIMKMDDIIDLVDTANGSESDIILLGDFNMPADDYSWYMGSYHNLIQPALKTTITDTSSYDNFWINSGTWNREYNSFYEMYKFDELSFSNDDDQASLEMSDHRPISATFKTNLGDDDLTGNWTNTAGFTATGGSSGYPTTGDIRIYSVVKEPTDNESVTLKNYDTVDIDISEWTLGDKNDPTSHNFSNGTIIKAGETLFINHSTLGFGINNTGEILYLKDGSGTDVDQWP